MRLRRVQVPDFRVLKNVDITFETDFVPQVFPLGSQNGGGKSTLLQLIFTLLHCSYFKNRATFLESLLDGFAINKAFGKRDLAEIDILDGDRQLTLVYFACDYDYSVSLAKNSIQNDLKLRLDPSFVRHLDGFKDSINEQPFTENNLSIEKDSEEYNLHVISNYSSDADEVRNCILLGYVKVDGEVTSMGEGRRLLSSVSENVFLSAPSTQVFLFFGRAARQALLKYNSSQDLTKEYFTHVHMMKQKVPNFFTYDFIAVNLFIELVNSALKQDSEEVIKTGEYGSHYHNLLKDLNSILSNKTVNVSPDLSRVTFRIGDDWQGQEIYPEDLSHGELKRLSIYMWLRYKNIKDSIVLMDEIEIALHPDWQYRIVSDLVEWAPSNQYILATHSYELCEAVTPAHVKELDPKLQNRTEPPV